MTEYLACGSESRFSYLSSVIYFFVTCRNSNVDNIDSVLKQAANNTGNLKQDKIQKQLEFLPWNFKMKYLYMYSNETLQTLAICFKRQNNCFLCLILTLPFGLSAKANEPGVDILYCISSSSLLDKTGSEKKSNNW